MPLHIILAAIVGLVSSYTVGRLIGKPGYGALADIALGIVGGVTGWRIAAYLSPWISERFSMTNSGVFLYFSFAPLLIGMVLAVVLALLLNVLANFAYTGKIDTGR